MDYQKKSNMKIGVSGAGKNYLKMPWSIEDTIENLEELKEIMQQKLIMTNHHGRGEKDAEEIAFDFDRAIQALKENQEYKKLGTLEEVREAVERKQAKKPEKKRNVFTRGVESHSYHCPNCKFRFINKDDTGFYNGMKTKFCPDCGQHIDWSEEE